jgi:hypothetical protein
MSQLVRPDYRGMRFPCSEPSDLPPPGCLTATALGAFHSIVRLVPGLSAAGGPARIPRSESTDVSAASRICRKTSQPNLTARTKVDNYSPGVAAIWKNYWRDWLRFFPELHLASGLDCLGNDFRSA